MFKAVLGPRSSALNDRQFDPNVLEFSQKDSAKNRFIKKAASVPKGRKVHVSWGPHWRFRGGRQIAPPWVGVYGKCNLVYFRITTKAWDPGKRKPQSQTVVRPGADDKRGNCTREVSAYQSYRIQESGKSVNAVILCLLFASTL